MKKYLSTTNIATMYDISPDFFRNRMGSSFIKGIHYLQHDRQCPIRWDVEEVEIWWRGENKLIDDDKMNELLERLMP